jgi:hypothetical protein
MKRKRLKELSQLASTATDPNEQLHRIALVNKLAQESEYQKAGLDVGFVLLNVTPDTDQVLRWTYASPARPEFGAVVADRINKGYLPLGALNVATNRYTAFTDVVHKPFRRALQTIAELQMPVIFLTLLGAMPKNESWLYDEPQSL